MMVSELIDELKKVEPYAEVFVSGKRSATTPCRIAQEKFLINSGKLIDFTQVTIHGS